jgi:hypothetical protein
LRKLKHAAHGVVHRLRVIPKGRMTPDCRAARGGQAVHRSDVVQDPIKFIFTGMVPSRLAENAARRRIRALRNLHPRVTGWEVELGAPPPQANGGLAYAVRLEARGGGQAAQGAATAEDLLGALRLAFNSLEAALAAQRHGGRGRAALWLQALRHRIAPRSFS